MEKLGLTAKAVNSVTKAEKECEGTNIWTFLETKINVP
jgi:hypothetical protein